MIQAVNMQVNFGDNTSQVKYRDGSLGSIVTAAPGVVVEYDSGEQVLGIEMRALDHETLLAAIHVAEAHGLEFPAFVRTCIEASEEIHARHH